MPGKRGKRVKIRSAYNDKNNYIMKPLKCSSDQERQRQQLFSSPLQPHFETLEKALNHYTTGHSENNASYLYPWKLQQIRRAHNTI